jgi:hypothetical protein
MKADALRQRSRCRFHAKEQRLAAIRSTREDACVSAKDSRGSKKRRRAARPAAERPERRQDPRLWAVRAHAQDGVPFKEETWVYAVSPGRMKDGSVLMWHPPMPVAFNLVEAARYRDRGVKERKKIMGSLRARAAPGAWQPSANTRTVIDCVFDLQSAVLCSFLAIESLANHAIETLPTGTTITVRSKTYDKGAMVRWMSTDDKYKRVFRLLPGGQGIAGTATWTGYLALKDLRG